jgi:hypothetical protein
MNKRADAAGRPSPSGLGSSQPVGDLGMQSLACNAGFGLEWLLIGKVGDREVRLLEAGIEFCNNLVETEESKAIKESLQTTVEALNSHINELIANKTDGKRYKPPYSEQETRRMQHFFNETSTPYLRRAFATMKRRHGRERI